MRVVSFQKQLWKLTLDLISYNVLIYDMCMDVMLFDAQRILSAMTRNLVTLDNYTCNMILHGKLKGAHVE